VKALALRCGDTEAVIITVDAVAIEEIGPIKNDYLPTVRAQLDAELGIAAGSVIVNASHCHGAVCADVAQRTVGAVKEAWQSMEPVTVGAGVGHEDRIMENRRYRLKDGRTADARRAYSLPPDEDVAAVGPIDPQIGILRLDRADGRTLAVLFNFACHPIKGVPSGGNTADLAGFAAKAIEDSLGRGAVALFVQGCAGDVNPRHYKDVDNPPNAEELGSMLGLSTLSALAGIATSDAAQLNVIRETLALPRADLAPLIESMQAEQTRLLGCLKGTDINLKTFIPLLLKHRLSPDFPTHYSYRYLHDEMLGRGDTGKHDEDNRQRLAQYIDNIRVMEQLTRVQINLDLLRMHHAQNVAAGKPTLDIDVMGLRVGDFVLVTCPGELSVQIGLGIKERSPHPLTFVAGCTNGYIYYAPTAEQLQNRGGAQEDSDCLLAPEWQQMFEDKVAEVLSRL